MGDEIVVTLEPYVTSEPVITPEPIVIVQDSINTDYTANFELLYDFGGYNIALLVAILLGVWILIGVNVFRAFWHR